MIKFSTPEEKESVYYGVKKLLHGPNGATISKWIRKSLHGRGPRDSAHYEVKAIKSAATHSFLEEPFLSRVMTRLRSPESPRLKRLLGQENIQPIKHLTSQMYSPSTSGRVLGRPATYTPLAAEELNRGMLAITDKLKRSRKEILDRQLTEVSTGGRDRTLPDWMRRELYDPDPIKWKHNIIDDFNKDWAAHDARYNQGYADYVTPIRRLLASGAPVVPSRTMTPDEMSAYTAFFKRRGVPTGQSDTEIGGSYDPNAPNIRFSARNPANSTAYHEATHALDPSLRRRYAGQAYDAEIPTVVTENTLLARAGMTPQQMVRYGGNTTDYGLVARHGPDLGTPWQRERVTQNTLGYGYGRAESPVVKQQAKNYPTDPVGTGQRVTQDLGNIERWMQRLSDPKTQLNSGYTSWIKSRMAEKSSPSRKLVGGSLVKGSSVAAALGKRAAEEGWYGIDLDGTLAKYDKWEGIENIGEPIPAMVAKVKKLLSDGKDARIFTARVANGKEAVEYIDKWCKKHLGKKLPVTNVKDQHCLEIWDDRAKQVVRNKGMFVE